MESKTKFTRTYVTDISTSVWHYDLLKFKNGPIKVEIEYAPGILESMIKPKLKKEKKIKTAKQKVIKTASKKIVNANFDKFI